MERQFNIGDRVCVVNGPRRGKVGTIVGYGSSKDTYAVHLSGIGVYMFVEYDLIASIYFGTTISPFRRAVEIEKVIFNNPATIVFWSDGKKTVVKCASDEAFDEEKGLAMAISKRVLGNQGNYYNEFKKWLPEIDVCEDKGVTMVEACRKAHKAVESFNKAMTGHARFECNSCTYLETPIYDEPCNDCNYHNSKYKPKKGDEK